MRYVKFLAVAMVFGISACSQEANEPKPDVAPAAVPAPVSEQQAEVATVEFTATPEKFRLCDAKNGAIAATVKWKADGVRSTGVAIHVVDREGVDKLWVKGGASGEEQTGEWVFPGTRFILLDEASGKQLAQAQVDGIECD